MLTVWLLHSCVLYYTVPLCVVFFQQRAAHAMHSGMAVRCPCLHRIATLEGPCCVAWARPEQRIVVPFLGWPVFGHGRARA